MNQSAAAKSLTPYGVTIGLKPIRAGPHITGTADALDICRGMTECEYYVAVTIRESIKPIADKTLYQKPFEPEQVCPMTHHHADDSIKIRVDES